MLTYLGIYFQRKTRIRIFAIGAVYVDGVMYNTKMALAATMCSAPKTKHIRRIQVGNGAGQQGSFAMVVNSRPPAELNRSVLRMQR
jgi:hypothetical protein